MTDQQKEEFGNPIYQLGNWIVTTKGIWRKDSKPVTYFIDHTELNDARPRLKSEEDNGHGYKYNKMLDVAQKTDWVTDEELQDFNYTYAYALGYFNTHPTLNFKETISGQTLLRENDAIDDLWPGDDLEEE